MRFMMIVKANKDTEAGAMPEEKMIAEMMKFNEEMANAGVMLAGEGLHPTSKGARIKFSGSGTSISNGPFPLTGDTIAGYWLIQAKSLDEAIAWSRRAPMQDGDEIEIRQIFESEDFGSALTKELREKEGRLREQLIGTQKINIK